MRYVCSYHGLCARTPSFTERTTEAAGMGPVLGWFRGEVTCATIALPREIALTLIEQTIRYFGIAAANDVEAPEFTPPKRPVLRSV